MARRWIVQGGIAALAAMAVVIAASAQAQMMGGGAAVAGNGVGGREFEGGINGGMSAYDADLEYQHGLAALQAGDYHKAQHDFEHSLDARPEDAASLFGLGQAYAGEGNLPAASHNYERSLKIDDSQIDARREYAVTLAKLGHQDRAQDQLDILKKRFDACGGSCRQAADLAAALTAVEAALSAPSKPG
jgi:tetratricopeptide (TPR) repeat protein